MGLAGKRVAITRPPGQAEELHALLTRAGAIVVSCPTVRVLPVESPAGLDAALMRTKDFDWVVFTSPNGVRAVVERMLATGRPPASLSNVSVAAVGPGTRRALAECGIPVAFVPPTHDSRALAESLSPIRGKRVLLARAKSANATVPERLRARGALEVLDLTAYRTAPCAPDSRAIDAMRHGLDGIVFTSPSTVQGFLKVGQEWPSLVRGAVVATIGPVTTGAAQEAGLEVHVESRERTMIALVEALDRALREAGEARGGERPA